MEGVTTVDNEIEVLPLSSMDDQTRVAVYRALYSKAPLQRYQMGAVPSIHIIVKNGYDDDPPCTVENEGDKDIAGIAANGVPGVFKVNNYIWPPCHRRRPPACFAT